MKYALYYDINSISTLYIYQELKEEFKKQGDLLDIFIPKEKQINGTIPTKLFTKYYEKNNVIWNYPDPKNYDILLVLNCTNSKRLNCDIRMNLSKIFKKVIYLKADSTREYWCLGAKNTEHINKNIKHGICTQLDLIYPQKDWIHKVPKFNMPFIENFNIPKKNALSLQEFKNKYNIKKKIILCATTKYCKLIGIKSNSEYEYKCKWFFENISEINNNLNKLGYELIVKLHKMEYLNKFKAETKYYKNIPIIEDFDTYEAILYSDYAITCGSMIVFEFGLYNLPCLEICPEKIFSFSPKPKFKLTDYIYGTVPDFNQLKNNTYDVLENFIKNKYKIIKNNPYYLNCENITIEEIVTIIKNNSF
jgi:hypothetical protein